jgi:hypothetical protein
MVAGSPVSLSMFKYAFHCLNLCLPQSVRGHDGPSVSHRAGDLCQLIGRLA